MKTPMKGTIRGSAKVAVAVTEIQVHQISVAETRRFCFVQANVSAAVGRGERDVIELAQEIFDWVSKP